MLDINEDYPDFDPYEACGGGGNDTRSPGRKLASGWVYAEKVRAELSTVIDRCRQEHLRRILLEKQVQELRSKLLAAGEDCLKAEDRARTAEAALAKVEQHLAAALDRRKS